MIILHIGLAKTASTLLIKTIKNDTDIIVIPDIYDNKLINKNYLNLSDMEKIKLVNNKDNYYKEASYKTIMSINFSKLDNKKIFFIKNPSFIYNNYELLINKIKNEGHDIKIIFGIRNMTDHVYSLYNHWSTRNELPQLCTTKINLYNNYCFKFYENINDIIEKLRKYNTIVYNFDNLINYDIKKFIVELFDIMNISICFKENFKCEKIIINNYEDTDNLYLHIKNYDIIKKKYDELLKHITIKILN